MNTQQGAAEILAHIESVYVPKHDYVTVHETAFSHLDLGFYRGTQTKLEQDGFLFLEDCEDRTVANAPGNVFMPVMIRTMGSADGSISAGIYHARVRAIWLRILLLVLGKSPGRIVDFETEFSDGSFVCTSNAQGAAAITMPSLIQVEYLPRSTDVARLLERHRQRISEKEIVTGTAPRVSRSIAEVRAAQDRMNAIKAAYRGEIGGVTKEELERLTPLGGRALVHEVHQEIQAIQSAQNPSKHDANQAHSSEDLALLTAVRSRGENTSSPNAGLGVLAITGFAFLAFGGLQWGWETVAFLALAIGLHEIGHVLAMRMFGYKNVRMLFIPFFGGLATGQPQELDATKNALVALAGPAFGLLTVVFAGAAGLISGPHPWLLKFAWVSLIMNAFNLLPIMPLDGGQFTNDTLFSRFPVLELVFRLFAIAALGWLSFVLKVWMLGAVGMVLLIATPIAFRRARLIRDARRDPLWLTRPLDVDAVIALRGIVTSVFGAAQARKLRTKLPEHVHGIWLEIRKRFPGPGRTATLLAGYFFLAAILYPAVALSLAYFVGAPGHAR